MEKLIVCLNKVLSDSYALYLKTQNYHWNVTGVHFVSLHALFEQQYTDLADAIDHIAETIRMQGDKVDGSFDYFTANTCINTGNKDYHWLEMVEDLATDQDKIKKTLLDCLQCAQELGSETVVDLMVDRASIHDKNKWMLDSISQ